MGLPFVIGWGGALLWQRRQRPRQEEQQHQAALVSGYYHKMAATITDRQALAQLLTEEIPSALGIRQAEILFLEDQNA